MSEPAYVALCRTCQGLVMATMEDPQRRREINKLLTEALRAGHLVQQEDDDFVRTYAHGFCHCLRKKGA